MKLDPHEPDRRYERLGLAGALAEPDQEEVRGRLMPHAAMKFLLPVSRANRRGAIELPAAIAPLQPTTRQTEDAARELLPPAVEQPYATVRRMRQVELACLVAGEAS